MRSELLRARWALVFSLSLVVPYMTACISSGAGAGPQDEATAVEPEPVLGETTPEELLSTLPGWVDELVRSQPDQEAAERLIRMAPGVEVEVFFGSWCSDSRRELTRLWRALELVGGESGFPVSYIGVDRSKTEPAERVAGREILYVPTLIVSKGGEELGRIVESAPGGVEGDLADLIEGRASGWLSARDDLEPAPDGDSQ